MYLNKQAFTLIELLIVVLIIGILAAVALPQYQKTVLKSKFSMLVDTLQPIAKLAEIYYLEHGTYPDQIANLDVELADCVQCAGHVWCNDMFLYISGGHQINTYSGKEYGNSQVYGYLFSKPQKTCGFFDRDLIMAYYQPLAHANVQYSQKRCLSFGGSQIAKKICQEVGL